MAGKKTKAEGHRSPGRPRVVEDPVRLSVDYERQDIEALEEIARERGVSVATLVRKAVSVYLKRRGKR